MKNKKPKNPHLRALRIVQYYFPQVESVEDGKKDIMIEVTTKDIANSKIKDHAKCAFATACKRTMHADGFMVSTRTAYAIFGKKAIRYRLPESVSREIVSYDRNAGFAPGIYQLKAPGKYEQLGARVTGATHKPSGRKSPRFRHITTGIRTVLGSRVAIS